mmetsp:Transcript_2912/g.6957  ORF Transcript_2912/g.6957 Transcript_2912/m.6957 type:complete len:134 (-) Transcript_2912:83-484(-)
MTRTFNNSPTTSSRSQVSTQNMSPSCNLYPSIRLLVEALGVLSASSSEVSSAPSKSEMSPVQTYRNDDDDDDDEDDEDDDDDDDDDDDEEEEEEEEDWASDKEWNAQRRLMKSQSSKRVLKMRRELHRVRQLR